MEKKTRPRRKLPGHAFLFLVGACISGLFAAHIAGIVSRCRLDHKNIAQKRFVSMNSTAKNILIVGAGAMGCLFGAFLARQGNVTLLSRNATHVTPIDQNGLLVEGMDRQAQRVKVSILADPARCQPQMDYILICTKAGSTARAVDSTAELLSARGIMLSLQNGLGNYEQITARVGTDRAMAGTTAQAATLLGPGTIRHNGAGITRLAAPPEQAEGAAELADLFNRAGIATEIVADRNKLLWSKLIINVGINALAALLRVPNGVLGTTPACQEIMSQAVDEALQIAAALHIDLGDKKEQFAQVLKICHLTANNQASMLQDVLKGSPTEIEAINGAVVHQAEAMGLTAPVNRLLTELVRALEATAHQRL